jgi:eukaryotic-like serine/threonine-protein kinase
MADEIIGGYKLLKCMMTGQSSQVFEVVEQSSHRHFAMKLLLPEKAKQRDQRKLLMHEASVGKQLSHPNVIRIQAVGDEKEYCYYVMEYFPSGSLNTRLKLKQYDFIKERAHSIFKQAAVALAYITASGWVHRDIKPDNMLVNSAGELRIIDFALAQHIQTDSMMTRLMRRFRGKQPVQGTKSYMSPEQIRGEPLDGRADIYSFGASCFELVTHRQPFRGATSQDLLQKHIIEKPPSPQIYNPDVTDELSDLVMRMLAKKRVDRPQTFHDVLNVLNTIRVYKSDPLRKSS